MVGCTLYMLSIHRSNRASGIQISHDKALRDWFFFLWQIYDDDMIVDI